MAGFGSILTLAVLQVALGSPVKQGPVTLRPPQGFRMIRMDLLHGTRAAIVAPKDATKYLAAALVDSDEEDAASLLVAVVERPFDAGPGARDQLATLAVRHFNDELGLKLQLERSDSVPGRAEVTGTVRQGAELRRIWIAAFEGDPRHAVVVASVPSGRWESLEPALRASFDSVKLEVPSVSAGRTLAWAALALAAALSLVSVGLWRRRAQQRSLE